jgi:o-succinylbenzoate synthase
MYGISLIISIFDHYIFPFMSLEASIHQRVFHFSFDARTSRGAMKEKVSWFLKIRDKAVPEIEGVGECGPLPGLSPEFKPEINDTIEGLITRFNSRSLTIEPTTNLRSINGFIVEALGVEAVNYPSVVFAFETALLDLWNGGNKVIFNNAFIQGAPIPINGLIWMGGLDFMLQQIEIKIRDGFRCVKLKVGGIDFEKECDVLQYIRRKYFRDNISIRLDANGAFKPADALYKLNELAKFDIHSIEQPIKPGSAEMEELCRVSPIPIALDEELIGINMTRQKEELLSRLKPAYIILKPTLHGGLYSCQEWIQLAEKQNIGWWITSALESNIGLNAIAQFTAQYPSSLPQGLGTGMLYTDNIDSPLSVHQGLLFYETTYNWGEV